MGRLIDGQWSTQWDDTKLTNGKFVRQDAGYRNWITEDGSAGPTGSSGFKAKTGRYHLYISLACPWAHRTLIFRELKGLSDHITVDVVHPDMLEKGWSFKKDDGPAQGDRLFDFTHAFEIYQKADPNATTRVTVPILWDKYTNRIVSNESSEIIRMFNSAFNALTHNTQDFWPINTRTDIEKINHRIYHTFNNGVYKAGFATSQHAYLKAVTELFDTMDWLENRLSTRRYLMGDALTEADWRLFTTLVRFDLVYHLHFKCNRSRLIDMPNLWAYTRELYQMNGIAKTCDFNHIVRHYHFSHETINPHQIVPINPAINWMEPHLRGHKIAS